MEASTVLDNVRAVAEDFSAQRAARQRRRELDPADFERLRQAGFLLTGVPVDQGGLWESPARSTRAMCEMLRVLASADSSVALVSSMHSVLWFWLAAPPAPPEHRPAWEAQRRQLFQTVVDGSWWGTIVSEPGSGGDLARTKAVAAPSGQDGQYRLSGQKQFASGSGNSSYVITVARPEGEEQPDLFYMDVRGVPWDGSTGMRLVAPWDGHGMIATQSHAFEFRNFPASRAAWPGGATTIGAPAQPSFRCFFTAVILGVLEVAMATARAQMEKRREGLRPFERVEWAQAELEVWLALQAYEGMLRAVEREEGAAQATLKGKTAVAELAESALNRLCRASGGGAFSRSSPLGFWAQDVRALGFLRPPWALAFDSLLEDPWSAPR